MPHDDHIDRLYQLPLAEFTTARNALAKDAGANAPEIKRLEKPSLAAWAVNQLFWRQRKIYDEVIGTAEKRRAAYRQQLAGKAADVRGVETAHRESVRKATQTARAILEASGDTASDPVMDTVREILDSLPSGDSPGRLTKPLKRTGFEALQGFTISPIAKKSKVNPVDEAPLAAAKPTRQERSLIEAAERERTMTTERLRFAEAAEREAEAALERTRNALKRAERVRERLAGELAEATAAEQKLRTDEATRQAAYDKAVAERERLAEKLETR